MSKTILANTDGFTPVIDGLVKDVGLMPALVFGRIWRFCQMEDGVCKASLETIAEGIGVDRATVMRHAKVLCDAGYLKDLTPDLKNRPHVYADTGKAGIRVNISGVAQSNVGKKHVAESNERVAESNVTVAESQLNKDFKKDSNKPPSLSEKEKAQANAQVDMMIFNAKRAEEDNASLIAFERAFGFGTLPWSSTSTWTKFQKFVMKIHAANPNVFTDYVAWRLDGGKYKAFSNRKIRENPQAFMDTGYPEFEASKMYLHQPQQASGPRAHKL
jgi:DNA-binding Lrp family transcriptional regulator